MSRHIKSILAVLVLLSATTFTSQAENLVQLGVGAHYWTTLDDYDTEDFSSDGIAWYLSTRWFPETLVSLDLEIERFPDTYLGGGKDVYAPAAYAVLGNTIYAAAGIGGYFSDGDLSDKYFYAFRAGLNLEVLPRLYLDINANYRINDLDDFSEENTNIDTDTITLGAAVRVQL